MSVRIGGQGPSLNSQRNLDFNHGKVVRTLEKLSSGHRIVRASDGPASLIISEQFRSEGKGIDAAVENVETAISMVQTSEAALSESSRILSSMRQIAIHAANEAVNDPRMLRANQLEFEHSLRALNHIAKSTTWGRKHLLDGSAGASGTATGEDLEFVSATPETMGNGDPQNDKDAYQISITQAATQATSIADNNLSNFAGEEGIEIVIFENGREARYTTTANDTATSIVVGLGDQVRGANLDVSVGIENGKLSVKHNQYGSEHTFFVSGSAWGIIGESAGEMEQATEGRDIAGTIDGVQGIGKGQELSIPDDLGPVGGLTIRYLGEEESATGSVFVQQNSQRFQVGSQASDNYSVSFIDMQPDRLGRGVSNKSGFHSLSDIDLTTAQGANDALELIEEAIDDVTSFRGAMGALQKNLLESDLQRLKVAAENLSASESAIRDADIAEEFSNLMRNEMLMESSTVAFRRASQINNKIADVLLSDI